MKKYTLIAIDLAKNVFQVCKVLPNGHVVFNKQVTRKKLITILRQEKAALVAMEACYGSSYWARLAQSCGHQVKVMHARHVKPYRTQQKTDKNDALAIAVAAGQVNIRATRIPTVEEQGLQAINRVYELAQAQRVAASNQLRGLLCEFGLPIGTGMKALRETIPLLLEDAENGLPFSFRTVLAQQWEYFQAQLAHEDALKSQLEVQTKQNESCQKLLAIEGIGPLGAIGLAVRLGDGSQYKNGRDASSCLGLSPKQHSSGTREVTGSIAKVSASKRLRSVLFQGAMSVVKAVEKRSARTEREVWLISLIARRGKKVAAVALANKNVRTAYAILSKGGEYKPQLLVAA